MKGLAYSNAECYVEDHQWRSEGGVCVWCGARLRCACGAFAKEKDAWWEYHLPRCRYLRTIQQDDIEQFERILP